MHDAGRALHLLAALDALLARLADRRADIVIERRDEARSARLAHNLGAFRVVVADHLIVVEEIEIRLRQRTGEHFEAIGDDGTALIRFRFQQPRVVNLHVVRRQIDTQPIGITAVLVTACEDLAIAKERRHRRRGHIIERSGPDRFGRGV